MQASVCVGNYATIPYYVADLEIPVYSMEELCYCIKENAFLLDISLMNDSLLEWIDRDCGLRGLAKELHPLVHKKGSLSAFVTMIMEYTGFYSPEIIGEVIQVLKQGAGLSNIEKRKSQIDYFVKRKKYVAAIKGYDILLSRWSEPASDTEEALPAPELKAAILHNKAVACTGLMMYQQAAELFQEAFRLDAKEEYMMAYLAAKRMELSEEEYIAFAAGIPDSFTYSLALEKELEKIKSAWTEQGAYQQLLQRMLWREGRNKQQYYEENDRLIQVLKTEYRSFVQE